jgi:hypothetical protein
MPLAGGLHSTSSAFAASGNSLRGGPVSSPLQRAIDDLAASARAPVVLENHEFGLIAYSRHTHPADAVRQQTILSKRATPAVSRWLAGYNLQRAIGPVHLPANDDLGMLPRLCLPVRHGGALLGYLWFIEAHHQFSAELVDRSADAASRIADLIWAGRPVPSYPRDDLLRALLRGEPLGRADLELLTRSGLDVRAGYQVCVAAGPSVAGGSSPRSVALVRDVLAAALPYAPISVALPSQTVFVLRGARTSTALPDTALEALRSALAPGSDTLCGVSDVVALEDLGRAGNQAQDAVALAAAFPELGPVVDWATAGIYRLVPALSRCAGGASLIPGLRALIDDPKHTRLLETISAYLDLAGNAQETAAALHLHRTSLYYRIERFEALTGANLKDGAQRTAAHLAIKAAHFSDIIRAGRTRPAS